MSTLKSTDGFDPKAWSILEVGALKNKICASNSCKQMTSHCLRFGRKTGTPSGLGAALKYLKLRIKFGFFRSLIFRTPNG